jgi:hypothetical protein
MKSVSKTINDNNRPPLSVDTVSLDRTAKDRIIAKRLEARCKLQDDVTGFLTAMKANAEPLLGHNPVSEDLLPYFLEFAQLAFDAEVQELLPFANSLQEKLRVLKTVLPKVHHLICSGRDGVWFRTVSLSRDAVGFGSWHSRYGEYNSATLVIPQRRPLWAQLRMHAFRKAVEWGKNTAGGSAPEALNRDRASDSYKASPVSEATRRTQHAEMLRSIKRERHWTMQQLAANCNLSLGTIKNIFKKRTVGEDSLATIEINLSRLLGRQVKML